MTKKKKIILISLAVTVALAVGVGGLVYAENNNFDHEHEDVGGNKLLGVGEMGYEIHEMNGGSEQWWDTQFIITNPNCERDLDIEWVALIAGEDVYGFDGGDGPMWYAEEVIFEGTPGDWYDCSGGDILIPSNVESEPGVLSPHEVWQVSIAELIAGVIGEPPPEVIVGECNLGKYTLEVTWSGAYYRGWWWWGYWRSGRPLTGWQKEKCWFVAGTWPNMAISEAEMQLFPSRRPFREPEWWYPGYWD